MYITDITKLSQRAINEFQVNPLKQQFDASKASLETEKRRVVDHQQSLSSYIREVDNYKRRLLVSEQLVKKHTLAVATMEKAYTESAKDMSLDWLKPEALTKFFESIGMRFVSVSVRENGEEAYLTFIRPPKKCEMVPVPAVLVTMHYRRADGALHINNVRVSTSLASTNNYIHPHVSSGMNECGVCMGNYFDVLRENACDVGVSGYQDHVILFDKLLSTYNPDSPYQVPTDIINSYREGVRHDSTAVVQVDRGSAWHTLTNPKLKHAASGYRLCDLIGKNNFIKFYEMVSAVPVADTLEDIVDGSWWEHQDDDSEEFSYAEGVHKNYNKILEGIATLPHPEDFGSFSDEYDCWTLDSDELFQLQKSWKVIIREAMSNPLIKNKTTTMAVMPELETFFPEPTPPKEA